jgi:hypothetical protein
MVLQSGFLPIVVLASHPAAASLFDRDVTMLTAFLSFLVSFPCSHRYIAVKKNF